VYATFIGATSDVESGLGKRRVAAIQPFPDGTVMAIAKAIGETHYGLSGSDIDRVLRSCDIPNVFPEGTKWKRIYDTFCALQRQDGTANRFCRFIKTALQPARWSGNPEGHAILRQAVNIPLSFHELKITEAGELHRVAPAATLPEAHSRANRLRELLRQRTVHAEVLRHANDLLLKDANYFHAVFEAVKGLAERVREKSDVDDDGSPLLDKVFEKGSRQYPILIFNRYTTLSEINEHRGLTHLMRGLFFAYRHTLAHEPALVWQVSEADALDVMSLCSLIHRRLDQSFKTTPSSL
jgi:uncharacterized protein (TIGR02391 family)